MLLTYLCARSDAFRRPGMLSGGWFLFPEEIHGFAVPQCSAAVVWKLFIVSGGVELLVIPAKLMAVVFTSAFWCSLCWRQEAASWRLETVIF